MNVLFFCQADFASNSMGHIVGFARELTAAGHSCAAAIPGDDRTSASALSGSSAIRPFVFSDSWERPNALFPDGAPADILHAWTPRDHVRRAVERCREEMPAARLVVHLEDNEGHLLSTLTGREPAELDQLSDAELDILAPVHLSHPRRSRAFLREADGVTAIVRELTDFVPARMPFAEVWPGVDFGVFHPGTPDRSLAASLGLDADEKMIFYPGNSHFANRHELQTLYEAVYLLNLEGSPCRLIRTGIDTVPFPFEPRRTTWRTASFTWAWWTGGCCQN